MPRIDMTMIRRILIGVAISFAVVLIAGFSWFLWVTRDLPSEEQLADYEPPIMSRVHAGDGKLVAEFAVQHRVYVPSEELPDRLIQAFTSAEDKTFFEHSGINLWGMFRGTVINFFQGDKITGGSTITQQVVKNMLVGSDRSVERKVREAVLALRIEKKLSKDEILELYMNEIYLGGRSYGVGAASLNYFGKSLGDLTLSESALLAGLAQLPGAANPYNNPERAMKRRDYVLERMRVNNYITKAEEETAKAEPLTLVQRLDTDENQAAAYYVEELRKEILSLGENGKLGGIANKKEAEAAFYQGGLSIRSTLDSNLQLIGQTALRAGLETYDYRQGWRGPVGVLDKPGDDFEARLKDFANAKDTKPKLAGMGNTWQLAVVRSTGKDVRLGLADGNTGTLAAEDAGWTNGKRDSNGIAAPSFKRGKVTGIQVGDVVFVSHDATPNVAVQKITDYAIPKKAGGATPWRLRQIPQVQGALVAMDPHTGRVLAMAGGYSFEASQFNRAVQAKRQPGSSFKPFVYATALENGRTPSSRVLDAPYVSCEQREEVGKLSCYNPNNYTEKFYGLMTLRFGVETSKNAMTVRLASDIGLEKVSEMGVRMGVYDELPAYESMPLGAINTTPLRMVTAYAELVNGGKQVHPVMLDRIQNRYGESVYKSDQRECAGCKAEWTAGMQPPALEDQRKQLMDPVVAYQMVSILQGAVEHSWGTVKTARSVGKTVGAKTGTTNDFTNAWTVGFGPDLVAAIYIGYDTGKMVEGSSGGVVASPVFRDFMMAALKDQPNAPFRVPADVEFVEVDMVTGCLPTASTKEPILEAFKPGTAPTESCAPGGSEAGFTVDYDNIQAGDEAPSTTPPAQPVPNGADLAQAQPVPGQPVDPNQQQPVQPPAQPPQNGQIKGEVY